MARTIKSYNKWLKETYLRFNGDCKYCPVGRDSTLYYTLSENLYRMLLKRYKLTGVCAICHYVLDTPVSDTHNSCPCCYLGSEKAKAILQEWQEKNKEVL